MKRTIPARYTKLGLKLSAILPFLHQKFGNDPEKWPSRPDVSAFIKEQYCAEFAPNVVNNIKSKDANMLKQRILELAKTDPDLGLKLLEL